MGLLLSKFPKPLSWILLDSPGISYDSRRYEGGFKLVGKAWFGIGVSLLTLALFQVGSWLDGKIKLIENIQREFVFALRQGEDNLKNRVQVLARDSILEKMEAWGLEYSLEQKIGSYLDPRFLHHLHFLDSACQPLLATPKAPSYDCNPSQTPWGLSPQGYALYTYREGAVVAQMELTPGWLETYPALEDLFRDHSFSLSPISGSKSVPIPGFPLTVYGKNWWMGFVPSFMIQNPNINPNFGITLLLLVSLVLGFLSLQEKHRALQDQLTLKSQSEEINQILGEKKQALKELASLQLQNEALSYQASQWEIEKHQQKKWDLLAQSIESQSEVFLDELANQSRQIDLVQNRIKNDLLQKIQNLQNRKKTDLFDTTEELIHEWVRISMWLDHMSQKQNNLAPTIQNWKKLARPSHPFPFVL
jgi:hypothetical protein